MPKIKGNPNWSRDTKSTISWIKKSLAYLSIKVRTDHFDFFEKKIKPKKTDSVLDLGVTPNEELVDSNLFEKLYPHKKQLTIASVEDSKHLVKKYKVKKFIKVTPGKPYPFIKNKFDIVVSWATLEHVGGEKEQKYFLKELDRVGKKVFLTTPYRYCIYEPHTELFFLHWLPDSLFRNILDIMGKDVWVREENLRPIDAKRLKKILPNKKYKFIIYKMFRFLPSHLLIYKA